MRLLHIPLTPLPTLIPLTPLTALFYNYRLSDPFTYLVDYLPDPLTCPADSPALTTLFYNRSLSDHPACPAVHLALNSLMI
jgi:hypothetical protein